MKILPVALVAAALLTFCTDGRSPAWQPSENPLFTGWVEDIDPLSPWPEYPRPGMVRDAWMSLNGLWEYAICGRDEERPDPEGKILVPYPVESALSGVRRMMSDSLALWYSREFVIPKTWKDKQLVLNFEASDWETRIWIDDNYAMGHRGGYDPFSCNITPYLSGRKKHTIVVRVTDPVDRGSQPRGKQVSQPKGIWYTPTTGIWQSVWLEPVEKTWIGDIRIVPDIDREILTVNVSEERCHGPEGCPPVDMAPSLAEVTVLYDGETIATGSAVTDSAIVLHIPSPRLWTAYLVCGLSRPDHERFRRQRCCLRGKAILGHPGSIGGLDPSTAEKPLPAAHRGIKHTSLSRGHALLALGEVDNHRTIFEANRRGL